MRRKFIAAILLTFALSTLIACGKTEGSQGEYSQSGQGIYDLPSQKEIDEAFYMVEEAERKDGYEDADYAKIEIPAKGVCQVKCVSSFLHLFTQFSGACEKISVKLNNPKVFYDKILKS